MGLINIDDRDTTNNYYTHNEANHKIQLDLLKSELKTSRVNHLGYGRFKIDLPVIPCTGSDVEILFNIPFMHELQKMEIKHTDSSDADSIDSFDYSLQKRTQENLLFYIHNITDIVVSDMYDEFVGYYHERCQYRLVSNTTNTDKLYISIFIQQE